MSKLQNYIVEKDTSVGFDISLLWTCWRRVKLYLAARRLALYFAIFPK